MTAPTQTLSDRAFAEESRFGILYIIDQLDTIHAGAERALYNLVHQLPARYSPRIVTFKEPEDPAIRTLFPCPIHVFPLDRTFGLRAFSTALEIRGIVRNHSIALTQTFFETSDLWAGPLAKLSGCPVLISSKRDMGYRRTFKHRLAYRVLNPLFDKIHAVSNAVRDVSLRDGCDPGKVVVISNGVDVGAATQSYPVELMRRRLAIDETSPVILDITNIRRVKGLDILARTAAIVCRRFPDAVFVVAGKVAEPDYMAELQDLITDLGIRTQFRFVGAVENPYAILQMSNIFCHLSRTDGLSNALLESMAAGLPSVVTRAGGNADAIDEGASGFVVPIENPELAADRIITLLRYPDCAGRLGERARAIAIQNFSSKAMAIGFVQLYDELLAASVARRR